MIPDEKFLDDDASSAFRIEGTVTVQSERGLHLRVAHHLVQLLSRFEASVRMGRDGRYVNAKSLLGLTTLGASKGVELQLIVEGSDAADVIEEVERFFRSGFDGILKPSGGEASP